MLRFVNNGTNVLKFRDYANRAGGRSCESGVGRKRRWWKGADVAACEFSEHEFICVRHVNLICITLCDGRVAIICMYN